MRYAVLVTGPAGAGKSTFCSALITHAQTLGRSVHLFNLDPAAERFDYEPTLDIRDLINLEDVMEELEFGPNGGLIYCFECVCFCFGPSKGKGEPTRLTGV
jgi:GTPase SAR1 family protein